MSNKEAMLIVKCIDYNHSFFLNEVDSYVQFLDGSLEVIMDTGKKTIYAAGYWLRIDEELDKLSTEV